MTKVKRTKIIICVMCRKESPAYRITQLYCQDCKVIAHRNAARENHRRKASRRAKKVGYRTCNRCQEQKKLANFKNQARTCSSCKLTPPEFTSRLPRAWKVEYQRASDPFTREIQELAPSACWTCKHLRNCTDNVQDIFYVLPCQREE